MVYEVPVLLTAFNRPNLFAGLVETLRPIAPAKLFVSFDGPRSPEEAMLVQATREVLERIDWPCALNVISSESNLGCGRAMSQAITWFFDQVSYGIILEDDIRPSPAFFDFVEIMLRRYEDNAAVGSVTGTNRVPFLNQTSKPYRFSVYPNIWGWGTWRRVWENYALDVANWRESLHPLSLHQYLGRSRLESRYWAVVLDRVASGALDTWDVQFLLLSLRRSLLTVVPGMNLVENVGFGSQATHTKRRLRYVEPAQRSSEHFSWPEVPVLADNVADAWESRTNSQGLRRKLLVLHSFVSQLRR